MNKYSNLYGIGKIEKDGTLKMSAKKGDFYFCMSRISRLRNAHPNTNYVLMYFNSNGDAKKVGE